jgi:hypothetical protein
MIRVPVGSGGRTVELEGETTEAEDVITVEDEDGEGVGVRDGEGVGVGVGSGAASPHRPY